MAQSNIDEFKAGVGGGFQKGSHFAVEIFSPIGGPPLGGNTKYFVKDATMPGRNMMTSDIKYGANLSEKKVNGSAYSPCTVTFISDSNLAIYKWFLGWQDMIQDPNTGAISFPDAYEGSVTVSAYSSDEGNPEVHTHKLIKAFPENVGDIQFSHGDTEFATFAVTFAYRHIEFGSNGITLPPMLNVAAQALKNINVGFNIGPLSINGSLGSGGFSGNANLGGIGGAFRV
jgi:hypothetical protein